MLNRALFSSVKDDWPTPWEFFHNLDLEFDFTLDVLNTEYTLGECSGFIEYYGVYLGYGI